MSDKNYLLFLGKECLNIFRSEPALFGKKGETMKSSRKNRARGMSRRGFLRGATVSTASAIAAASPYSGHGIAKAASSKDADDKPKSWKTPPDPIPETKTLKTIEADVVILGGGIAGVAAARSAAEAGVSVAVVEKQPEDRYTFFGNEIGTVNPKISMDAGIERIDPQEFFEEWQRRMGNRTNPQLVRQYVYKSGAACDWLIELIPDDSKKTLQVFGLPRPKHYAGKINGFKNWTGTVLFYGKGFTWSDAMKLVAAKAKSLGAVFYFGTSAQQVIKEGKKAVGAIAKDDKGNYIKFMARKGVLIACGDFSRNKEMIANLMSEHLDSREPLENFRGQGRDGDGQKMGIWAGGRMERGPRAMMNTIDMVSLAGAFGKTAFLRINREGKRYTNEASWASIAQGFRQSKGLLSAVWDSNWREELEYQALDHGSVDLKPKTLDRLERELNALNGTGADGGMVRNTVGSEDGGMPSKHYCADTFDRLADYLGYKDQAKKNFLATIERYNDLARKGVDEDFGKDPSLMHPLVKPPFFGTTSRTDSMPSGAMVTLAGLVIDENQRVLDDNDDPIPGLFATGNCSGGRYSTDYITPISGNSIGWAFTMGRIAGKYIAESS
jgi:fumarate reductase flavoprotein subunit